MYNNKLYIQRHFGSVKEFVCFYMLYYTACATEVSNSCLASACYYVSILHVIQNLSYNRLHFSPLTHYFFFLFKNLSTAYYNSKRIFVN